MASDAKANIIDPSIGYLLVMLWSQLSTSRFQVQPVERFYERPRGRDFLGRRPFPSTVVVVDLVLTGSPPKSSTAEASREATPHPDGTCNCDLDVGFLSALLYINPCYRRKGNREPGSADESGNRWLQGFHAFQALGRFATSVHRLEPPDEPSSADAVLRCLSALRLEPSLHVVGSR